VFRIYVQVLSLFIPITVQSHITITAPTVHYLLPSHNSVILEFSTDFLKVFIYIYIYIYIYYISQNFVRLYPSSSMQTERQTDTTDEADSRFSQTFELLLYFVCQLQYIHDTQDVLSTTSSCSFLSTQL